MASDSGLQAERTGMAWQRTALGVGGIGALLLHSGEPVSATIGAAGLLAALVLLAVSERRYERIVLRVEAQRPASRPWLIRLVAVTVAALGVGAALFVVLPQH